jgi:phosphotransferase system HPr-like phosphotransfer protein
MSTYSELLRELKLKIIELQKPLIITAKEFIPKLYISYLNENTNLTSIEVRNKVIQDCKKKFWSQRTILAALLDEAKNLEQQKTGKQSHKNRSSATITAADIVEEQKIFVSAEGERNTTYSNEMEALINENFELKQIIQKNAILKTAASDIIGECFIFTIPKQVFPLLMATIENSRESFQIEFDKNGNLVDVRGDIIGNDDI